MLAEVKIPVPYPDAPPRSLAEQRRIVARVGALLAEVGEARKLQQRIVEDTGRVMDAVRHELFSGLRSHAPSLVFDEVAQSRLGKMLSVSSKTGNSSKLYLRNANVLWDDFNLDEVFEMDFLPDECEGFRLQPGDLLICEGGEVR